MARWNALKLRKLFAKAARRLEKATRRLKGFASGTVECPSSQVPVKLDATFQDLPKPWLAALVAHHLDSSDRQALFATCKAMGELVLNHCPGLTLQPSAMLQNNSNRAATVMGMAAQCANIHLHVNEDCIPLDITTITSCVTQLTYDIDSLGLGSIQHLPLSQLTAVHSITFVAKMSATRYKNNQLQLLPTDALPSLRSLQLSEYSLKLVLALPALAEMLSSRVTELVLSGTSALSTLSSWPSLLRVEVRPTIFSAHPDTTSTALFQQMLYHKQLKHVRMPTAWLTDLSDCSDSSWDLDTLELTEGTVYMHVLSKLPLQGVKRLKIMGSTLDGYKCRKQDMLDAMANLGRCASVQLVPAAWSDVGPDDIRSIPAATATICASEVGLDFLASMLQHYSTPVEALVFTHNYWSGDASTWSWELSCLQKLPRTMHTICWRYSELKSIQNFAEFVSQLPNHIHNLVISNCSPRGIGFSELLSRPAPAGLRSLILQYTCWLKQENLQRVQALVRDLWPSVEVIMA